MWSDNTWERRDMVLRENEVQDDVLLSKALVEYAEKVEVFNIYAGRELVYVLPVDEWQPEEIKLEVQ